MIREIKKVQAWCFRGTFNTPDQMRLVVERVLDGARKNLEMQEEKWYDIKLVLHELCCNAVNHGKYPVEVFSSVLKDERTLHITVTDSGKGFIPNLKKEVDANCERGRGLKIVKSLSNDVIFNSTANKVTVRISI